MIFRIIAPIIERELFKGKAILILGARQVGKSTILESLFKKMDNVLFLDAENADIPPLFQNATVTSLKNLIGSNKIVVIDEAQKIKNIGSALKLMTDYFKEVQVIATGSSAFELRNNTHEPLTGRKWEHNLYPLSFPELVKNSSLLEEKRNLQQRLLFGGYPEIVNSLGEEKKRLQLITESYLYKDILLWSGIKKPEKLINLLRALAMQIGQEVSYNELGKRVGLKSDTIENYIQLLEQAFVIFRLPAFSRNARKELKRGRKIYFYDNGIRNALLNDYRPIEVRTDKGALWENYIISELWKKSSYEQDFANFYFWRTQDQQEIDLIIEKDGILEAYEIKWSENAKAKLSKTFSGNYPDHIFKVINNENYADFLG